MSLLLKKHYKKIFILRQFFEYSKYFNLPYFQRTRKRWSNTHRRIVKSLLVILILKNKSDQIYPKIVIALTSIYPSKSHVFHCWKTCEIQYYIWVFSSELVKGLRWAAAYRELRLLASNSAVEKLTNSYYKPGWVRPLALTVLCVITMLFRL